MLGASAGGEGEVVRLILAYGITPVVVIVLSVLGVVWYKPAVDRLLNDLDAVNKKLEERDAILRDIVVPAVTESNQLLREVAIQLARRRSA